MKYVVTWMCVGLACLVHSELVAPLIVHFILAYMMGAINVMLIWLTTDKP